MITKEFLASCTDEQINKGVAWLEVAKRAGLYNGGVLSNVDCLLSNATFINTPDYCSQPARIMPIAFANSIDLASPNTNGTDDWQAYQFDPTFNFDNHSFNTNPLRAICEVYILMSANK